MISFNTLLGGLEKKRQLLNCEVLLAQMRSSGVEPDTVTYNILIRTATAAGRPKRALAYRGLPKALILEKKGGRSDRRLRNPSLGALEPVRAGLL